MQSHHRLQTFEVNYKVLAFKYPSTFNQAITQSIISIFSEYETNLGFDIFELQRYYSKSKPKKLLDNEYRQYANLLSFTQLHAEIASKEIYAKIKEKDIMLLRENLHILSNEKIIFSYNVVYYKERKLSEVEKYFLYTGKERIVYEAKLVSESAIINYVIDKMLLSAYPYNTLADTQGILGFLNRSYFEVNTLIYSLISSSKLVVIPLFSNVTTNRSKYREYLIPGNEHRVKVKLFLVDSLIPAFKAVYISLRKSGVLKDVLIDPDDINKDSRRKVLQLCFLIINLKSSSPKSILVDQYNIAHLTLDCWLVLENDPISVLNSFPDVDIDSSFLSPFLSRYIQDFGSFTKYLKMMRSFISGLSQLIEREDLIEFFVSKGVRKKLIESFILHLPTTVISFNFLKKQYIIEKGQIVRSILHLANGAYHRNTRLGRFQFEILARIFRYLEHKTKNLPRFVRDIKITPQKYKEVILILANESHTYTKPDREVDKEIMSLALAIEQDKAESRARKKKNAIYSMPLKTVYKPDDFKHFSSQEREEFFKVASIITLECLDEHDNLHELYLKRDNLFPKDLIFLDQKPSYELICEHFNL